MMSKLDRAIEELRSLPEEDQDAAAEGLHAYALRASTYRLAPEQIAKLEARLAAPLDVLSDAETDAFFNRLMA